MHEEVSSRERSVCESRIALSVLRTSHKLPRLFGMTFGVAMELLDGVDLKFACSYRERERLLQVLHAREKPTRRTCRTGITYKIGEPKTENAPAYEAV